MSFQIFNSSMLIHSCGDSTAVNSKHYKGDYHSLNLTLPVTYSLLSCLFPFLYTFCNSS